MAVWICSYLVNSTILSASRSQRYSQRSVVYAIRYPSDFRCIRVLNSEVLGYSRCVLGFRFPEKYAHQNDPLNQGYLHELKLRLKIVRYPGIEVAQPQEKTITFSAEQLVKFVANVVNQVTQPQVCYANPTQDTAEKKSCLCRRVSEAGKNQLGVDITGISLFDAIGQLRPSAPSASKPETSLAKGETSFKFSSSTKVIKPSAILKSLSPPPPPKLN